MLVASLALSGLGRDALRVVGGLGLACLITLAFSVSSLTSFAGVSAPGQAVVGAHLDEIPPDQLAIMQQAAAVCGLPWQILAAVAKVESDFGQNMATSSAGAIGYGQFEPGTWAIYGNGGNPYDYHDALPAMARYLCASGAPGDIRAALFAYNHAEWYVNQVLAVAIRYGYGLSSAPSNRVVALARSQIGMPYVWGASDPRVGFDCSGLVQWVYAQVGINLPRTAQAQYDATQRLAQDQVEPGDLVFFANTYPSADPITHVGIYVGDGLMVNAANPTDGVGVMPVFTGYWGAHYAGAGRVGS
ncbi:MAG TPA: bifunctional lytic transglycosylase/C40 family peptidase [Chloroflexota bacterium]|nr:bifunctional lytic transglycosylase/C40 family peptidase [Chloroflexota bacterium]